MKNVFGHYADSRNARCLDGRAGRLLTDCLGYALSACAVASPLPFCL